MRTSCRAPRTRIHTLRVSRGKSRDVMTNVKAVRIELNAIRGWLEENKLSIHLGKMLMTRVKEKEEINVVP